MCAAFIAQQQGVALPVALKKIEEPIEYLWLVLAEFARQECWGGAYSEMKSIRSIDKLPVM